MAEADYYGSRTSRLYSAASEALLSLNGDSNSSDKQESLAIVLILSGADPTATDQDGWPVLHQTVRLSYNQLLKVLLQTDRVNCNHEANGGWTPLMIAADVDNEEAAKLLLKSGSNPDKKNYDDGTAYSICQQKQNSRVLPLLQPVQIRRIETDSACYRRSHETSSEMLSTRGDISTKRPKFDSPISTEKSDMTTQLLMTMEPRTLIQGCTEACSKSAQLHHWRLTGDILHCICQMKIQLAHDDDHDVKLSETIFSAVIRSLKQRNQVYLLLDRQVASLAFPERLKEIAKHLDVLELLSTSIVSGNILLAEALLDHVNRPDLQDSSGGTVLMLAAQTGNEHLVEKILNIGASVDIEDDQGMTALSRACRAGHVKAAMALINFKADVLHRNRYGQCCRALAERNNHWQLLQLLIDVGSRGNSEIHTQIQSDKRTSLKLHSQLNRAGFTADRIRFQCDMADFLQELARQLTQEDRQMTGSYAEGWGNSLVQVNGRTAVDSDIDWTVLAPGLTFHLQDGCQCHSKLKVLVIEGHAQVQFPAGSQPAVSIARYGSKPAEDTCYAYQCCSSYCNARVRSLLPEAGKVHLVGATRPNKENELRVSFSFQEKLIMRQLSDVQGQLFIIIKFIFKMLLPKVFQTPGLKTYHAKTLLFFMLEKNHDNQEVWKPENLVLLLKEALGRMLEFMDNDKSPDVCIPHFFMPGAALYMKNAGILEGPFRIQKERIREKLQDLRRYPEQLIKHLSNHVQQLETDCFYFHPLTLLPLRSLTACHLEHSSDFRDVSAEPPWTIYSLIQHCLVKMQADVCSRDSVRSMIRRIPDWSRSARLCLTVMLHLKCEEMSDCLKLLKFACHSAEKNWSPDVPFRYNFLHKMIFFGKSDWAWRFCFASSEKLTFSFLPPFCEHIFTFNAGGTSPHTYINFRCLWFCLKAELMKVNESSLSSWQEDISDDPDFEELAALAHYSDSYKQIKWCVKRMLAIENARGTTHCEDEMIRGARKRSRDARVSMRSATSTAGLHFGPDSPEDWSDKHLTELCSCHTDASETFGPNKQTLLSIAAMKGNEELVSLLLMRSSRSFVSTQDVLGRTAISWAALKGSRRVLTAFEEAFEHDAEALRSEVNRADRNGQTPIILAAIHNQPGVLEQLCRIGGDVNCQDFTQSSGMTYAAKLGFEATVLRLLCLGANAKDSDSLGNSPLIWAARCGHSGVIKVLGDHVTDPAYWMLIGERELNALEWAKTCKQMECALLITDILQKLQQGSSRPTGMQIPTSRKVSNLPWDQSQDCYPMTHSKRGIALTINNFIFSEGEHRVGSEFDEDRLKECFTRLGFEFY